MVSKENYEILHDWANFYIPLDYDFNMMMNKKNTNGKVTDSSFPMQFKEANYS